MDNTDDDISDNISVAFSDVSDGTATKLKGPISRRNMDRHWLEENRVPQMLQSLMAGLMLQKPEDHFEFLDTKLEEIKEKGVQNVNWETFVQDLHPKRNAERLAVVHDEYWEKNYKDKVAPETTEKATQKNVGMTPETTQSNLYKPKVFNLTEPEERT